MFFKSLKALHPEIAGYGVHEAVPNLGRCVRKSTGQVMAVKGNRPLWRVEPIWRLKDDGFQKSADAASIATRRRLACGKAHQDQDHHSTYHCLVPVRACAVLSKF